MYTKLNFVASPILLIFHQNNVETDVHFLLKCLYGWKIFLSLLITIDMHKIRDEYAKL